MYLTGDDFATPLTLGTVRCLRIKNVHGIADRRQWIAQLVSQCCKKLVFAAVSLEECTFCIFQA